MHSIIGIIIQVTKQTKLLYVMPSPRHHHPTAYVERCTLTHSTALSSASINSIRYLQAKFSILYIQKPSIL